MRTKSRDFCVHRVPKTYPAYFGTYERFDEIVRYTDKFENLFLVGRNGMHKYNNQDHSMLTAMMAVENILAGVKSKQNLWEVNTEQEYHEQKAGRRSAFGTGSLSGIPQRTTQPGLRVDGRSSLRHGKDRRGRRNSRSGSIYRHFRPGICWRDPSCDDIAQPVRGCCSIVHEARTPGSAIACRPYGRQAIAEPGVLAS